MFVLSRLPASCRVNNKVSVVWKSLVRGYRSEINKPKLLYRTVQKEDENKLTDFLGREYYQRENVSRALGILTPDEFQQDLDSIYPHVFKDKVSVIAECITSGEIVGVTLAILETRLHSGSHPDPLENIQNRKYNIVCKIDDKLKEGVNLYNTFGVDKLLHRLAASVKKGSESLGVGVLSILASEERGIQKGAQVAYGETTSVRWRKALEGINYDILREQTFRINPEATSIFEKEGTDIFCALVVKRLT